MASLQTTELANAIAKAFIKKLEPSSKEKAGIHFNADSYNNAVNEATELANSLATAIEEFVKSGEVSFTAGKITGTTAVNGSPTPLTVGAGTGGKIT